MPGQVKVTDIIFFIDKADIPADRCKDVTYDRIVVSCRHKNVDLNCTRLTVGGDRVNYPGYCGKPKTDLLTVKRFLNSTIYIPGACFMTLDIKDFYLVTPM